MNDSIKIQEDRIAGNANRPLHSPGLISVLTQSGKGADDKSSSFSCVGIDVAGQIDTISRVPLRER